MNFSRAVQSVTDPAPPKGTPRHISPQLYAALDDKDKRYYTPEYKEWKEKRVREYEDCDLGHTHFVGWTDERTPIGEPYRYRWRQPLMPAVIDTILNSNVIADKVLNKKGSKMGYDKKPKKPSKKKK